MNVKTRVSFCGGIISLTVLLILLSSVILVVNAQEDDIINQIKEQVIELGCQVFSILFYLAAAIAALFIIFSGIKYTTSESAEDRYDARDRIVYAVIGLVVVVIACPLVEYFIQGTPMEWEERPDCCPIFSFGTGGSGQQPSGLTKSACEKCIEEGGVWCTVDDVCYGSLTICHGLGCSGSCISSVSGCPSGSSSAAGGGGTPGGEGSGGTQGGEGSGTPGGGSSGAPTGEGGAATDCTQKEGSEGCKTKTVCSDYCCNKEEGGKYWLGFCESGYKECSDQNCCCFCKEGKEGDCSDGVCKTEDKCKADCSDEGLLFSCKPSKDCDTCSTERKCCCVCVGEGGGIFVISNFEQSDETI